MNESCLLFFCTTVDFCNNLLLLKGIKKHTVCTAKGPVHMDNLFDGEGIEYGDIQRLHIGKSARDTAGKHHEISP